jgi:capsular exopolysaccharide synthesis family protein
MQLDFKSEGIAKARRREDLELWSIARVWWYHRIPVILITTGVTVLAFLSILLQERAYTAEALIEINRVPIYTITFGQKKVIDPRQNPSIATKIVHLTSRAFLRRVAEEAGLFSDEEFAGNRDSRQAPSRWNQILNRQRNVENLSEVALWNSVVDTLAERIFVEQRRGSHVISVEVKSRDREKAAHIANTATRLFIEGELASQSSSEAVAMKWLSRRIAKLRGQIAGLEGQILERTTKYGLTGLDHGQFVDQAIGVQIAELTEALVSIKADGAQLRATYQQLVSLIQDQGADISLAIAKTPNIERLRLEEARLYRQLSELGRELGDRHPEMIKLGNQIYQTRQLMAEELGILQSRLENEIMLNNQSEEGLKIKIDLLKKKAVDQNKETVDLINVRQQLHTSQNALHALSTQYRSIEQAKATQKANIELMSPAGIPTDETNRRFWPLLPFMSLVGTLLALAGIFLWDRWVSDFGYRNNEDLRDSDLKPLGIIPELPRGVARGMAVADYIVENPHSAQAEAMQRIRNRLHHLRPKTASHGVVALVTSQEPLEGKSTAAVILARQAANSGLKTLLIDADIRNPCIHRTIGIEQSAGLCELLEGENLADDLEFSLDPRSSLEILQAGDVTKSMADVLHTKQLVHLLEDLRMHYDWIYIDSPSLGAVSDGIAIAHHADMTLCLMRWLTTTRTAAALGVQQLKDAGANIVGVALSRVDLTAGRKYQHLEEIGYYGYYHHRGTEEPSNQHQGVVS